MILLNAENAKKALPVAETIQAMKQAYAALSGGNAEIPLRARLTIPPHEGISLFMPAFVQDAHREALALKAASVFPRNPERGLPTIHAAVLVFEADSGRPLALLEGGTLTAIRTGAASGAATDLLARRDAKTVTIIGKYL